MSLNSSNHQPVVQQPEQAPLSEKPPKSKLPLGKRIGLSIGISLWVLFGFFFAQAVLGGIIIGLEAIGISFEAVNGALYVTTAMAIGYILSGLVVIGAPWFVKKISSGKQELGLRRGPNGFDFLWAPLGFIAYIILTSIVMQLSMVLLPFIDYTQKQETGFSQITTQFEYVLAFLSLVVIAPLAEEILFRGYLFGKLRKYARLWVAILITSIVFGVAHWQGNVGIDVFALSIVLCLLRVWTGSLWAPIMLHMIKNGIAFYFLFINPSLLSTLGG